MKSKLFMKIAAVCVSTALLATVAVPVASAVNAAAVSSTYSRATEILNLKTNDYDVPLAVEDEKPVFSWEMDSTVIGQQQTAYQIIVTRDSDGATMWDSGKVESNESTDIYYEGEALTAETAYSWDLTVWDAFGQSYTQESKFETGLMNPDISAWGENAQFIGTNEMTLDAASACVYAINADVELTQGTKASLVFGADDYRLKDQFQNVWNAEGENWVRLELDVDGVQADGTGAKLNVYKQGYDYVENDGAEILDQTIDIKAGIFTPENMYGPHNINIDVSTGSITVKIDGQSIKESSGGGGWGGRGGSFSISAMSTGNNYNTFPNLASVGFAANPGEEFEVTNYVIHTTGKTDEAHKVVFGKDTGATYDIFRGLNGVSITNNKAIRVSGGAEGILSYADPSYGSLNMVRTTFSTDTSKKVKSAKMYATAMGIYEMYINGGRMGEDWFNPADSQYRDTLTYHAYDVTDMIQDGENAMGAILAGGWYTGYMTFSPGNMNFFGDTEGLLSKLVITYEDGSTQVVSSNPDDWKMFNDGPIEYSSFFQGERYNANKEAAISVNGDTNGWSTTAYDDSAWEPCEVVEQRDWIDFDIVARYDTPIREFERLDTTRILNTHSNDNDTWTYDMGVAMVGVPSVTIPAGTLKEGDTVIFRYGEDIYPGNEDSQNTNEEYTNLYGPDGEYRPNVAGRVLHDTYRAAMATDFYTATKEDETRDVVIQPSFTFRGYRYIQITVPGLGKALPAENVKGVVISSIDELSGTYDATTTDDTITGYVNQLFKNIQRSQLGNFMSIPTDCPQRNERMGWTGDAQAFSRTSTYNANTLNFFRQWMVALRDDQYGNGSIGDTVPEYSSSDPKQEFDSFANSTTWGGAVCMVPWQMYTQYGDTRIIEENMDAMKLWLDGMDSYDLEAKGKTYTGLSSMTNGKADWLAVDGSTDSDLLNNAIYIYLMEATAEMARVIGRTDIADEIQSRHDLAKQEWNEVYFNSELGMTTDKNGEIMDTQASYAAPLNFNCVSDENLKAANARLSVLAQDPNQSSNGAGVVQGNSGPGGSSGQKLDCPAYSITTGFNATPNILPALTRGGNIDDAYNMFTCTEYASWLYPVTKGATTMWERWNSYELAFQMNGNSAMNSFNHFALGAVGSWMYEYQMGITTDHANGDAGYQDFVLQPLAGGIYTGLEGSYESNYGTIESDWTATEGTIDTYSATVPANTTATLYLPVEDESVVADFENIAGVTYTGMTIRNNVQVATFSLASGSYDFAVKDGKLTASIADGYIVASTADKTILNKVIAYAEDEMADENFNQVIPSVQESFKAVLQEAKEVAADITATETDVYNAWTKLLNEIHKLGFVQGDKSSLESLIAAAGTIEANLDKYVDEGKEVFTTALANARAIFNDGDAMQAEIDEVSTALLQATLNLRFKADKTILDQVIQNGKAVDANSYTAESYAVLTAALATAEEVYNNDNATQDEVDTAVENVQAAIKGLVAVDGATNGGTSATDNNATQTGQETTTPKANASKTGDVAAPVAAVAMIALAGAALVATKKHKK
ncbi:family 78 glycoside hydrolase catalytic domain [Massilioclostridium coli]|uniref:family 78 glycoside hydrolase catalytic domain n=1 Tax=Massilioclostridium coli TaxID=1870991 RepID=UPI0022E5D5E1|nr:family 78 glycoside hydrolase catalytic domain [Massilioclostridium coli]